MASVAAKGDWKKKKVRRERRRRRRPRLQLWPWAKRRHPVEAQWGREQRWQTDGYARRKGYDDSEA